MSSSSSTSSSSAASSPALPPFFPVSVELLYAGSPAAVTALGDEAVKRGWSGAGAREGERVQLGEGSIWDHRTGTLHWIDIHSQRLHSMKGKVHSQWPLPSMPGTVVLTSRPQVVLVACADGLHLVDVLDGAVTPTGIVPDLGKVGHRCNDGKTDPSGRFVVGTMNVNEGEEGREKGSLYRVDASGELQLLARGLSIPNGLAWNSDGTLFWHTDTPTGVVREFPYGSAASDGRLGVREYSEGRVAIRIPDGWGHPDGCSVDEEDHLWIASWGGGRVGRFSPHTGELVAQFQVAEGLVSRVSSVAFGGEGMNDLFITTAAPSPSPSTPFDYSKEPLAGSLFVARNLPVKGRQHRPFIGLHTQQP